MRVFPRHTPHFIPALLPAAARRSRGRPAAPCASSSPASSSSTIAFCVMEPETQEAVEKIHESRTQAVLVAAGGGSQGLAWVLSVPGASGTVLEALVPYSRPSMLAFLGREPSKYVCAATARQMALAAYRRALRMAPAGTDVAGVALTAALATSTPKRGEHGVFVAAQSARGVVTYGLTLAKGSRGRVGEDRVAGALFVHALAEACGVRAPLGVVQRELMAGEALDREEEAVGADALDGLLHGRTRVVELAGGRVVAAGAARPTVLLPGSFNPLHEGHTALLAAAVAAAGPGAVGGFELSVSNADKGILPRAEVERRAAQFAPAAAAASAAASAAAAASADPGAASATAASLVLTDAPLFGDKAALLPGTQFVVGVDTALRIVMPKYYGGEEGMCASLAAIRDAGCSFLVAGRLVDGSWLDAGAVRPPPGFEALFRPIPAFRADISSTELRERAALGR